MSASFVALLALAALLAAVWVALATRTGAPVSTTHTIAGGLVGVGLLGGPGGPISSTATKGRGTKAKVRPNRRRRRECDT